MPSMKQLSGCTPPLISKKVSQGEESRRGIASFIDTGTLFSFYAETMMLPFKTIFCSFSLIERQNVFHETLKTKAHKNSCQMYHLGFMILKVKSLKWAWDFSKTLLPKKGSKKHGPLPDLQK